MDYILMGVVTMATNVSSIVIMIPGLHHVKIGDYGNAQNVSAYVVLFLFVMLPALAPVALTSAFGSKSDSFLNKVNVYVTRHSRTITGLVCAAIAVYLFIGVIR